MSKFKIGDEIIIKNGLSIVGSIIYQNNDTNYIIFPGAGNIMLEYNDKNLDLCKNNFGCYELMINREKEYWSIINKNDVRENLIELKHHYNTEQYILKRPTLLEGLSIYNNSFFRFTNLDNPKYLDHYIDNNNLVWVKIFFSKERVVGWIQSYKIKFKYRIFNDLFSNLI